MPADREPTKLHKATRSYLRYSGIGFQMAAVIGLATYGGWWLDGRTGWGFPLFTLVGALGGVAVAIYILFRETSSH